MKRPTKNSKKETALATSFVYVERPSNLADASKQARHALAYLDSVAEYLHVMQLTAHGNQLDQDATRIEDITQDLEELCGIA